MVLAYFYPLVHQSTPRRIVSTFPTQSKLKRRAIFFTVFVGGMSTLAFEFTLSRMLQTVYGTSNLVWANVIGLVLLFLTLGYFWGGRLADRHPTLSYFYSLVTLSGFSAIFFLLLTSTLLRQAAAAMAELNANVLIGSFIGITITLAIPITLLGMLSPFAIRLAVEDVAEAGKISGQIYAISTLGSLIGTWLPVLFVIPLAGSRLTSIIFGTCLLATGLLGLWQFSNKGWFRWLSLVLILIPAIYQWGSGPLKPRPDAIFETESAYNYIQVIRRGQCNFLLLNEGIAFHSFQCDDGSIPAISVWSSTLAAPYFNPLQRWEAPERMLVIGLAGGTIPQQYLRAFPTLRVDGIEPDPEIISVGKEFFALDDPRIQPIIGDGRYELNRTAGNYDVITIDAYRVPYIPWQLTTVEFFQEVKTKLTHDGVVVINVGRVPQDRRLSEAITASLLQVFPTVHTIDVPDTLNTLLFASVAPTHFDTLQTHIDLIPANGDPLIPLVLRTVQSGFQPTIAADFVFTDDVAPVETIVDSLVIRYFVSLGLQNLPTIER